MPVLEEQSDIARQFALGDLGAFETLFRKYQSEVNRWTVRIVRDPAAAEDLTIETFWRIYRAHARFDPERSFGAWARRIATNAALDYLKGRRQEIGFPADFPSAASPDPGVQHEVQHQIRQAFQRLPAKLQLTATLALIEELPYKDISDALGISVGAVKLRVFRALRQLRKNLKRMGVQP
jgi:RNA polymerase sigma factor (sigma-70 family)